MIKSTRLRRSFGSMIGIVVLVLSDKFSGPAVSPFLSGGSVVIISPTRSLASRFGPSSGLRWFSNQPRASKASDLSSKTTRQDRSELENKISLVPISGERREYRWGFRTDGSRFRRKRLHVSVLLQSNRLLLASPRSMALTKIKENPNQNELQP